MAPKQLSENNFRGVNMALRKYEGQIAGSLKRVMSGAGSLGLKNNCLLD